MEFRIADTFTNSLAQLTGEEQKAAKTTAFDLQMNPDSPGMQVHKLDRTKDKKFLSVRVSSGIRLIIHRTDTSLLLCYVDHHDAAYRWAERRRIERHPKTGAAQLVEVRETVLEIKIRHYVEDPAAVASNISAPKLFKSVTDDALLGYGVPSDWLHDVREATEDTLFDLAEHLPHEAAEALLELATGGTPQTSVTVAPDADPFAHPDAQRRFRIMTNVAELERALNFPWEKWAIFLHPAQRHLVERDYNGPARVSGSAGTGKTIVALHRAVYLARSNPDARVLLTTFSETLANALRGRLRLLIGNEPKIAERLETLSLSEVGRRLYEANFGSPNLATDQQVQELLQQISGAAENHKFSNHFLWMEWANVVDAWQLETWEEYRDVKRLGRKTRLAETQRRILWSIFEQVHSSLRDQGLLTQPALFGKLTQHISKAKNPAFDFAVIDEAQDIGVEELRFLAALGTGRPDSLFFAGDLGQRIFQQPFSWKSLGIEIQGRSRTLRINYRTSHQIRRQADRLLGPELADVDGNTEDRRGTISVFNGPEPAIELFETESEEVQAVAKWIRDRLSDGIEPHEVAVFVRSTGEFPRAKASADLVELPYLLLDEQMKMAHGRITLTTMHLAKGLEFRAVVVMACDDEIIPLQARLEAVSDPSDLEDVYQTERHLLYVACTRARDQLLVTGVSPGSEFLEDLRGEKQS